MQLKGDFRIGSNPLLFLTLFCIVGLAIILILLFSVHPAVQLFWQSWLGKIAFGLQ